MSEAIKNTATQGAEQAAGTAATSTPAVNPGSHREAHRGKRGRLYAQVQDTV